MSLTNKVLYDKDQSSYPPEQNDGRIGNPMVLDGMKDAITSLDCLNGMMAADTAVTEPSKAGTVYKASDR